MAILGSEVHFECTKCGACCKETGLLVTVTGHDITRLSLFLGLSASEMLRALDFYVLSETDDAPAGMRDIPSVNTEHGYSYIAIRKMENNECVFLSENLCMIHQFRPGVCRSFPLVFGDKEGSMTWGLSAMKEICPGLGTGPKITTSDLEEIASPVLKELAIYRRFVEEWNTKEIEPSAISLIASILSDPGFTI